MPLDLEVINTRLDPEAAEVTIQHLPDPLRVAAAELRLEGQLSGPHCRGRDGVNTFPLSSTASEDGFVRCHAIVPRPGFWSPEAPNLYRAQLRLLQDGNVTSEVLNWGFKTLTLSRKSLRLNDDPLPLRGVRLTDAPDEGQLALLHEAGVNLLQVPLSAPLLAGPFPALADQYGFLVFYVVSPEDEAGLWNAEAVLFNHVSTLGFVLPQATMREPQLWHNAMLHLHGHRREVYVGVQVEEVPVGLIQGHVEFLIASPAHLADLGDVKTAKLAAVRRADLGPDDLPPGLVGHISRTAPGE